MYVGMYIVHCMTHAMSDTRPLRSAMLCKRKKSTLPIFWKVRKFFNGKMKFSLDALRA